MSLFWCNSLTSMQCFHNLHLPGTFGRPPPTCLSLICTTVPRLRCSLHSPGLLQSNCRQGGKTVPVSQGCLEASSSGLPWCRAGWWWWWSWPSVVVPSSPGSSLGGQSALRGTPQCSRSRWRERLKPPLHVPRFPMAAGRHLTNCWPLTILSP